MLRRSFLACSMLAAGPVLAQEPPSVVSTTVAHYAVWQDHVDAVGSLRAVRGADLAAEVSGVVDWIGFDSGRDVAAGTELLRLRPNDDSAKLQELQAAADLADANLARDQKQFRVQAVSQATIDADQSHVRGARAQVAQQQALMGEKIIRAPFAGRLGLRQVDIGQYLPAGTPVVTLQALDPIYVDFYVPQQTLSQIRQGASVQVSVDGFPNHDFNGSVTAISPKLDQASRMAQLRATIANPDHTLLPGMFSTVHLNAGSPHRYITLPLTAVVYNPYGSVVYVAARGNPMTVHTALVRTGATRGDQVAVLDGLREGDVVVTSGQVKLHQGSVIAVNNAIQPPNEAQPQAAEE